MTALGTRLDPSDAVALLDRQTEILEQIATGAGLAEVLAGIAITLERLMPDCHCSVLLLDGTVLRHGTAPSLPRAYSAEIDGMTIGADAGSCGTAAWSGEAVIADDIERDPRWTNFRELAGRFGLRACWSTPICGGGGVCGTFAVYHRTPHRPTPREEQLVERLTHLTSVAVDHSRALDALAEAADRAKTDFVAALGHELRTPLQAITGFTELLATMPLDEHRRTAALGHITGATEHVLAMVDEVLDVARIEARTLPLTLHPVALAAVVDDVLAMVRPLAEAEQVRLRVAGTGPVCVLADERRLRQVLLNLVTNAIRYNRVGGEVVLDWTFSDVAVAVTVADTGAGIAAEHLDRLFTPFDRLGRNSDAGIGLGLPLARGLAEAMHGCLGIESVVGEGTTVTLRLPRG